MPIVAITREMGSLGKDVARQLGAEPNMSVLGHEMIDHLADRRRVRENPVIPPPPSVPSTKSWPGIGSSAESTSSSMTGT